MDANGDLIRQIRGNEIAMIFQEPLTSLSPVHTIGNQIEETVRLHQAVNRAEAHDRAIADRIPSPAASLHGRADAFDPSGRSRRAGPPGADPRQRPGPLLGTGRLRVLSALEVRNLKMHFPIQKGVFRRTVGHVRAVDGVDFSLRSGETLGLVGESGCGKTTTGRLILRALEATEGQVLFRRAGGEMVDITTLSKGEMIALRREMQIIFQDPFSSLNPRMTVSEIVAEPLVIHRLASGAALKRSVQELLEAVGLKAQHLNRYPYAFSGGQRQRIGIARALALRPRLIVADEPVSALDVSLQAQVLNLLEDLQEELGLTYLFIAHDLSVVEHISDRVAVMYLGKIVEIAEARRLYENPRHPYTEALLSAISIADPDQRKERIVLSGDVPSPSDPPSGCKFHPRCRYAPPICSQEEPQLTPLPAGRAAACHFAEELDLAGVSWTDDGSRPAPAPTVE